MTIYVYKNRGTYFRSIKDALKHAAEVCMDLQEPEEVHELAFDEHVVRDRFIDVLNGQQVFDNKRTICEISPLRFGHPTDGRPKNAIAYQRINHTHYEILVYTPVHHYVLKHVDNRIEAQRIIRAADTRRGFIDNGTLICWKENKEVARIPDASKADLVQWVIFGEVDQDDDSSCDTCGDRGLVISPTGKIHRCGYCKLYSSDEAAANSLNLNEAREPKPWKTS